jgi:hypothetical protein
MRQFFIILFYLSPFYIAAQQWIKTYGPGYEAKWVIEYYDKGYVILGTKSSNAGYCWVIKTDINGNILWNRKIGNGYNVMFANDVELTNDNGLIIAGTTSKYGDQQDAYILKLNPCGELEWCSDVYTPTIPYDLGWRVKPTSDNGYLLLGLYNDPNPNFRTNLFKFDSNGYLLWHQKYLPDSAAFEDDGRDLIVDYSGSLITLNCYYPNPGQSGGYERFYLIKTDTAGYKLWSTIYGKTSYYYGSPLASIESSMGNYYSFGWHDVLNSTNSVPAMIKVLNNGTPSYNKDIISNVGTGGISTAAWLNNATLILAGGWAVNDNGGTNVLFKTDTLGNVLQTAFLDTISNGISSMAKTFDNKFIGVGTNCPTSCYINAYKVNSYLQYDSIYNHPFTYDSLCDHPIQYEVIDPNCQLVTNVEEPLTNPETCRLKVFPNPATISLTIEFPKYLLVDDNSPPIKSMTIYHQWKSTILESYDLNGKLVFQREIPKDQTRLELDVSSWGKGMYFFRLVYNKQMVAEQQIIIQ